MRQVCNAPELAQADDRRGVPIHAPILMCVLLLLVFFGVVGCGTSTSSAGLGGVGNAAPTATSAPTATATAAPPTSTPTTAAAPVANPKIAISGSGGAYSSFGFSPATITIKAGSTVVWTNNTAAPHTVTSDANAPAAFNSGMLSANGGTFKFTFTKPGTYTYHCSIHPYMMGTITVVAA